MSRSSRQIAQPKPNPRDSHSLATLPHPHTPTLESRNFQELVQRAKRLYNSQQMIQALSVLQRGLYYDPLNAELNYLLAVANLSLNRQSEAVKHLEQLKRTHPHYSHLMMLTAIAYKKMGKLHEALDAINLHLQQQEDVQGLFYRAKISLALTLNDNALIDLNRILALQPRHGPATLNKINCLLTMNQSEQALSAIRTGKALVQEADKLQEIHCEQAKLHIKHKDFNKALAVFDEIDKTFPNVTQDTMLLKAKALQAAGKSQQSMMLYNDILAKNSMPRVFSEAVSQAAIACMRERDFYESFTYLKRTHLTKIRCGATDQLLKLTEGVTFLMKKKYAEGQLLLGACELNFTYSLADHLPFLRNLLHNAMAFAHFSLGNHPDALALYLRLTPEPSTDPTAADYNVHICQGILHHRQHNRQLALESFEKAATAVPRPEPYFYMAVILNEEYLAQPINTEGFVRILELIETGLRTGESAHMYYYRSILYLFLGMNAEALEDIDRAIERSEDNVAKYFYTRGVIFMLDRNYEQAVLEFSTALSIDDHDEDSLLQKGKCELLNGDPQNAFATISNAHQHHQMKLLFLLHQKQYAEILAQEQLPENIKQICSFMEGKFEDAGPSGKLLLAILYENYAEVVGLIEEAVGLGVPVGCLQTNDLLILKAFSEYRLLHDQQCLLTLSRVEGALRDTNKSSDTYSEEDERKLLLCKVNVILVNHRRGHQMEALSLLEELIGEVCQGPIFDQLELLRQALVEGTQHEVDFALPTALLSDYFATDQHLGIRYKFLIPLPNYHVPQVEHPQYEQLLLRFTLADIDNKPQAPWIRRGQFGVIFTNEVREFENLNLKTEENQAYRSRLPTSQQSRAIAQKKSELIEYLRLSASVLDKLDRLARKADPNPNLP